MINNKVGGKCLAQAFSKGLGGLFGSSGALETSKGRFHQDHLIQTDRADKERAPRCWSGRVQRKSVNP
jgi:hypothetical protein